ncbi:hypothetical protein BI308_17475 [Roseofilum reptotaenium AO1-A]|uniref:Uncharacterized protein n=1 Tax=Roseofilum reptotaenium AO1-A TaxID=1925591 RepID=A0A1L9QNK1_9CYAN|nr:hypothetical protein BI308_17475 [Roseofilum reptotaenium AO1-A]
MIDEYEEYVNSCFSRIFPVEVLKRPVYHRMRRKAIASFDFRPTPKAIPEPSVVAPLDLPGTGKFMMNRRGSQSDSSPISMQKYGYLISIIRRNAEIDTESKIVDLFLNWRC